MPETELKGRTCVVGGANGLIGAAVANALSEAGARVFSLDREFTRKPAGERVTLDLLDEKALKTFADQRLAESRSAPATEWIFVHCAYPRTPDWGTLGFENVSMDQFNENARLQLGGTFLWCRTAVGLLEGLDAKGALINFSSIYGLVGPDLGIYEGTTMQNPSPYAAIKAGVIGLTRYIATVYGPRGIRANVVCPGGVRDRQPESFIQAYSERTPLGRMAVPSDIAGAVTFLAGPRADYMTGVVLPVDGGWTAW
jgi:NAD(P)-dependent dehydrogenase (short-subunit alcohol dehydrogenase family)